VLVQEMVKGGVELILGGTRDPTFGPTVVLGIGGSYTELIREYSMGIAPLSPKGALALVAESRMKPVLEGYRGGPRVDLPELARVVSRFSRIMADNPRINDIEVNPLVATGKRFLAVDFRAIVS